MHLSLLIAFWVSAALVVYIYFGYPLTVWAVGLLWRTKLDREPWTGPISVVVVAYNEATRLRAKLDSIFASDCAAQIQEVLIGSDGSTDATSYLIDEYADDRVRLIEFPERRGKPACLNDLIAQCTSEVVILTDARQKLHPEAISKLAANFADVRVGAVSGELVLKASAGETSAARGIGFYWRYEKFIRRCESRFRSVPGATGALYAIRRNVFRPIPEDSILDDVVLPMRIIERGYHCAFEPEAVAYDEPSQSASKESIRKRRTIAGCVQLLRDHRRWLNPSGNPIWWEYVSHKILRLFSPLLLVIAAVTNVALAGDPWYLCFASVQGAFYLTAFMGWHYQRIGRRSAVFGPSLMFVALNLTTLAAWWDAMRGRFTPKWQQAGS